MILAMRDSVRRALQCLNMSLALAKAQELALRVRPNTVGQVRIGSRAGFARGIGQSGRAQAILGELHAYDVRENIEGGSRVPASLSLADRFDAVLDWGRRIASALSPPVILGEARLAAQRLLARNTAWFGRLSRKTAKPALPQWLGEFPANATKRK